MNALVEKPRKIRKFASAVKKDYPQFRSSLLGLSGFHLCQMPEIKNIVSNYKYAR